MTANVHIQDPEDPLKHLYDVDDGMCEQLYVTLLMVMNIPRKHYHHSRRLVPRVGTCRAGWLLQNWNRSVRIDALNCHYLLPQLKRRLLGFLTLA